MAANQLPIPEPPRTPTPPSNGPPAHGQYGHFSNPAGLGVNVPSDYNDDSSTEYDMSPYSSNGAFLTPYRTSHSPNGGLSPPSVYQPPTPQSASTDGGFRNISNGSQGATLAAHNPFNFTTQQYVAGRTPRQEASNEALGKRRGHKYRHSSIHTTHQIFQPPTPKTPLKLPASLPMPTRKEAWRSFTSHQTMRLVWCGSLFLLAGYVQFSAGGSLSMMALSRLILFDAAGAAVSVLVDVMGNFEVWKRSSIKHPFGLERADVLAGFGLAVFISFMGLDVLSHGIQHSLENIGQHEAHSPHSHRRVSFGTADLNAVLAIISTVISAILLKNHGRVGKAMKVQFLPANWGRVFGNPSHLLTLSTSALLLLLPLLNSEAYKIFDAVLAFSVAGLMMAFGSRLGTSLASMLLMSFYPSSDKGAVREVIAEMEADPSISAVEEARFWQVHYGLCMANIKLRYWAQGGHDDGVSRLRQWIASLVRSRLGGNYGSGSSVRWDVSVQLSVERD